jgi:RNA recognition motif-containing protein
LKLFPDEEKGNPKVGKKLYVGGLSYSTTEESLENLFAQAGVVESARIITDRDTGRAKGFGFVEMSNDSEASRAITLLNGIDFEGRNITVNEARPQTDRPQRGGYRGGGYNNRY